MVNNPEETVPLVSGEQKPKVSYASAISAEESRNTKDMTAKGKKKKKKSKGGIKKMTHREKWICGLDLKVAIIVQCVTLSLSLIALLAELGSDDHRRNLLLATTIITILALVSNIMGLCQKSPRWMLVAAIMSGLLFISAVVTIIFLFRDEEHKEKGVLALVMQFLSLFLALMNCFMVISYRNMLLKKRNEKANNKWKYQNDDQKKYHNDVQIV